MDDADIADLALTTETKFGAAKTRTMAYGHLHG
jgi:hypothetical protein